MKETLPLPKACNKLEITFRTTEDEERTKAQKEGIEYFDERYKLLCKKVDGSKCQEAIVEQKPNTLAFVCTITHTHTCICSTFTMTQSVSGISRYLSARNTKYYGM
jgi:hypothetical protein